MGHVWIFQPDNNPNTNLKFTKGANNSDHDWYIYILENSAHLNKYYRHFINLDILF